MRLGFLLGYTLGSAKAIADTLGVVLKHASDHDRAVRELRLARG